MTNLNTASAGNVPVEVSSFIGRRRELDDLGRLVEQARLVTLLGPGGAGKTRTAMRLGMKLEHAFADGVWWAGLGAVDDPELLVAELLDALNLSDVGIVTSIDVLVNFLRDHCMLLILDNCEHLLDACAALADRLLRDCPDLRMLTTSREALGVYGETTLQLSMLTTPRPSDLGGRAGGEEFESVALFADRGAAAAHGFVLNDANRAVVGEICVRLDGLPLAIELAATRLRALSPEQILDRIGDPHHFLTGGSRTAPDRHRTLRASLEWSYELCTPAERTFWARLSVFRGGFEMDAVDGVCAFGEIDPLDVLDLVQALVSKSIVIREEREGTVRFRLLETIRRFGRENLDLSGESVSVRRRHRDWFAQMMGQAEREFVTKRQLFWLRRLHDETPNVQAALDFCLNEPGEAEAALGLVAPLAPASWASGRGGVVQRWLERALAAASQPTADRALALINYGYLFAVTDGDHRRARESVEAGRAIAVKLGDDRLRSHADLAGSVLALAGGEVDEAMSLALAGLARVADGPISSVRLGLLTILSTINGLAGRQAEAMLANEEILVLTEQTGESFYRSYALSMLAQRVWHGGVTARATSLGVENVRIKRALSDQFGLANSVRVLAHLAAADGRLDRAATLLGASAMLLRATTASDWEPTTAALTHGCEQQCRDGLGEQRCAEAVASGFRMSADEAVAFALGEQRGDRTGGQLAEPGAASVAVPLSISGPVSASELTRRESEIARLVADGLTNRQIAGRLVISPRTVEGHVDRIFGKLGFNTRTQLVAWVARRQA